ncbi:MAG: isoleucine--tRNA ligase [Clostridia bacterium]
MYKRPDSSPDYPKMQQKVLELWKEKNIKKRVLKLNEESGELFSFYEGPPTANGEPHAGHVLTRSLKDVYTRFAGMNGYYVPRKGGWDTHGLPVEIAVERSLNISGKQDIEKFGVEKFIEECKKNVWKYIDKWKEFSEMVGYSLDLDEDCYNPYENYYIESVWWSLDELNKKGFLYKGYKILPSCPSCQTALSSQEVAQGYKDKTDITIVAKFWSEEMGANFLAWTTTPWTLPSNVALCVNPNEKYALVANQDNERFILASALVEKHFKDEYVVVEEFLGKDLVGKRYEPVFNFYSNTDGNAYRVVSGEFVTLTDGTGIVHIAPAYGEDDAEAGRVWGLPFLQLVDHRGIFGDECGEFSGKYIFDENENLVIDLIKRDKVFSKAKHTHSYPHCWRCKNPLMYFARDAWFVKTTAYLDDLLRVNREINWFPKSYKEGRMGNFLKNNVDWCLSRNRYWGTPLNVWMCPDCSHYITVGSIEQLVNLSGCDPDIELHKPYIDEPKIPCEKCGGTMSRESEVIDVWYDSGAMPFAQFHYPFENQEEFKRRYPADFIFEGYDQTRGWFYSLEAINTALFNSPPMRNCLANGMICDEKGQKMSKSLGNYTDPMEYIKKYGGDTVRFMFYSNGQPYNDVIFSENLLVETQRSFLNILYNSFSFYVLYADIDKFAGGKKTPEQTELSVLDKYILSKYNGLIISVKEKVAAYMATEASRDIMAFCDELSNWYIRRSRKRFWGEGFSKDKEAAFVTLYTVLSGLSRLCAPFAPFISETIYQTIERPFVNGAEDSVHLSTYPQENPAFIDKDIERLMHKTYRYCELGRSARNLSSLKIRQPLSKIYIKDTHSDEVLPQLYKDIIKDELNIKEVVEGGDIEQFVDYSLKPQLKTLGPKYNRLIGKIREYLATADAYPIIKAVKAGGVWQAELDGQTVEFGEGDLLISTKEKEGFASAGEQQYSIVLDTALTEDLINEGYSREFISRVQALRKAHSFDITDRINIQIDGDEAIVKIILSQKERIMSEILVNDISRGTGGMVKDSFEFEDSSIDVAISK